MAFRVPPPRTVCRAIRPTRAPAHCPSKRKREREEEREKGRIRRDGRVKNAESCERRRGMCVYKTSEVGRAREYVAAAGAELYRLSELSRRSETTNGMLVINLKKNRAMT